jgi:hypothetical protein
MTLATVLIYILLVLGIALVALGVLVVARQLLSWDARRTPGRGTPAPYLSALVIVIGIASLGTAALLSLKKPASTVVVEPSASTAAASAAAASTTVPSTAPASTAASTVSPSTSAATSPAPTGAVSLSAPAAGAKVEQCDVFTGTSSLPQDETIVIGVRNLDDAGNTSYLEPVNGWDKPSSLTQWTGFQYFGSGDASLGQTYQASVIVMPSAVVKAALADPANHTAWGVISLPPGSVVKQTLRLSRVSGLGPAACQ